MYKVALLKKMIFLFMFFFIISHMMLYTSYKRYDMERFPQDSKIYLKMAKNIIYNDVGNPFKYRILTPAIVKSLSFLPYYNTEITTELDVDSKRTFFHFFLVNYIWILGFSILIVLFSEKYFGVPFGLSLIGGVFYILCFSNITNGYIPIVDVGTSFFILLLAILKKEKLFIPFLLISLIGVLQKETVTMIMLIYCGLHWIRSRFLFSELKWLIALIPPIILYGFFTQAMPSSGYESYYSMHYILKNFLALFSFSHYDKSFVFQGVLGFSPLILTGVCHYYCSLKKIKIHFPMHELWLLPCLFLLSEILGLGGGNGGRIIAFGHFIYIPYMLKVFEVLYMKYSANKIKNR